MITIPFLGDNVLLAAGGEAGTFLADLAAWAGGGCCGGLAEDTGGICGCCRRTVLGVESEFSLAPLRFREMEPGVEVIKKLLAPAD